MDDLTWQRRAACRLDPSLMWADDRILEAKQLCSVCPVLTECAEWETGLDVFVPGVIAGRDEEERANSRKSCARCLKPVNQARASSYCRGCAAVVKAERAVPAGSDDEGRRQCPQCREWFWPSHGLARFCCAPHRVQYHRNRGNQRRRNNLASTRVLG